MGDHLVSHRYSRRVYQQNNRQVDPLVSQHLNRVCSQLNYPQAHRLTNQQCFPVEFPLENRQFTPLVLQLELLHTIQVPCRLPRHQMFHQDNLPDNRQAYHLRNLWAFHRYYRLHSLRGLLLVNHLDNRLASRVSSRRRHPLRNQRVVQVVSQVLTLPGCHLFTQVVSLVVNLAISLLEIRQYNHLPGLPQRRRRFLPAAQREFHPISQPASRPNLASSLVPLPLDSRQVPPQDVLRRQVANRLEIRPKRRIQLKCPLHSLLCRPVAPLQLFLQVYRLGNRLSNQRAARRANHLNSHRLSPRHCPLPNLVNNPRSNRPEIQVQDQV